MKEGGLRRWGAVLVAATTLGAACLTAAPVSAAQPKPPPSPTVQGAAPHPAAPRSAAGPIRHQQTSSSIPWLWQNPKPSGNPLYAISCVNASFCWAVGYDDIAYTQDGGAHWARGSSYTLFGISCSDISHCVAVGNGGVVVTTNGVSATSIQSLNVAFLAGVSCPPGTTVCYTIGASGFVFKSTDSGLTWVTQQQVSQASFYAISCADASHCVAVGANGLAAFTVNGATWSTVNTTASHSLYGVSCPMVSDCLAVGLNGDLTATASGGSSWNFAGSGMAPIALYGVSCPSTGVCFMAGADGNVYARDVAGGQVRGQGSTGENGAHYGISCPALSTCFAAGDYGTVAMTSNGGTGWTPLFTGLSITWINVITCPSATVCFVLGINGSIGRTTDGGTTWTLEQTSAQALLDISCATTIQCVAVGYNGAVVFTTDGTNWGTALANFGSTQLNAVSCVPSTSTCYLISPVQVSKSTDGGNHWAGLPLLGQNQLSGISCPAVAHCFVSVASQTGIVGWTTDDATWHSIDLISDPEAFNRGPLYAIACPDVNTCYAVGSAALIATTTDGGQNWRTDGPNSVASLTGVSCPSPSVCYATATDTTILHTTDYGANWDVQMSGSGARVACVSTTTCFAAGFGNTLTKTTTAGAAWTVQRPSGDTAGVFSLSCFGFSSCYAAANGSVLVSHDGGGTWTAHALNSTTDQVLGISCSSATVCYAAGWPSSLYKTSDGGGSWTRQSNAGYGADRTFTSISCSDITHCVVVGDVGLAISTADGSTWTPETTGTTQNLWGVFCPTSSPIPGQCIAVGSNGTVLTRASGSWSLQSSGTTNTLYAVECAHSSTTCYAVGRGGTVLITSNGGSGWAAQASGTTQNLHGIDCMLINRCIAVGNAGMAIITTDGSTWANLPVPTPNWLRSVSFKDTDQVIIGGLGSTLIGVASCTSAVVSSNVPSPQPGGTAVTFSAGALGPYCTNPLFEWWLWSSATNIWTIVQPYGPNGQFTLDTTGMTPGTYTIDVWVESQGSVLGLGAYEAFALQSWVVGGCDWATVVANPGPSPNQITYDTQSGGAGCAPAQYQFWLYSAAGGWQVKQTYSANGHYTLDTSTLPNGTYTVDVWVKQRGSPLQYETWALSTFALGACGNNATTTVRTIPTSSPQPVGTSVTVNPSSNCSAQPFYKYFVYPGTQNAWQVLQDYDRPPFIYTQWDTTGWKTGTQSVVVHVLANRPTSANPTPDTWTATSFSLLGCSSAGLTTGVMSPQPLGTPLTFTAIANGSCPQPQYQFWYIGPAGSWRIARDWSPTATFNWDTSNSAPGTYAWVVYVRQSGSGNALDTFALISVTVS